jgi:hypothetical protein
MKQKQTTDWLTLPEIAGHLRQRESWVYRYTRLRGPDQIPHLRAGKRCLFKIDEVEDWLRARQYKNNRQS